MCKNNSRESACSGGLSPLQNCNDLIGLSPAIGYYSYTQRLSCNFIKSTHLIII